jgi:periplasmic copper chaperone A
MAIASRRKFLLATTLLPVLFSAKTSAHSYKHGAITVGHAWALPARFGDGQVFMPLVNNGKENDALLTARSEMCTYAELRTNNRYDDPPYQRFELEPGKPFPMRPTSRHVRLVGLNKPLVLGEYFPLILDFEFAGEIEIAVTVEERPSD